MGRKTRKRKGKGATATVPPQAPEAAAPAGEPKPQGAPEVPSAAKGPRLPDYLPSQKVQVVLAVLAGLLLGFSHPFVIKALGAHPVDPTGLSGLLVFVGFVPLFFVIRASTVKAAFWLSFVALLFKYTVVLWWITVAINVFGRIPLVIAIILLMLLAATVAAPVAATIAGGKLISERFAIPFWFMGPVALASAELVRNYGILGGFPWGVDGYALAPLPVLIQVTSVVGIYGLTAGIVFINAGLTEALVAVQTQAPLPRAPILTAAGILAFILIVGVFRMSTEPPAERTVRVGLLQGNIEQGIKNDERLHRKTILSRYWELQAQAVEQGADIVVWPEAAVPVTLRANAKSLKGTAVVDGKGEFKGVVPPAAIIGSSAGEWIRVEGEKKKRRKRYNTVFAVEGDLVVKGRMDKKHLVPFGEYVPWPFSRLVKHLVPGLTTPGEQFKPVTIETPKGPLSVGATVCYEGAFPEITLAYTDQGAELMFNVTNDAWYGISSMTWQHTYMYAIRAVESGRPIARAANTGVSAWVDTRGRVHDVSEMYETTVVMADVPLVVEDTVYASVREIVCLPLLMLLLGLYFYALAGVRFWERERHAFEWTLAGLGVTIALATLVNHWLINPPGNDDGLSTQNQIIGILAILVGTGALSGRRWGYRVQIVALVVAWLFGVVGLLLEGALSGVPWMILTAAIVALSTMRRQHYRREQDRRLAGPWVPNDAGE